MERRELDMAFSFAYSLDGEGAPVVIDYDLTAPATYTPATGDLVKFDANGKVVGKHPFVFVRIFTAPVRCKQHPVLI